MAVFSQLLSFMLLFLSKWFPLSPPPPTAPALVAQLGPSHVWERPAGGQGLRSSTEHAPIPWTGTPGGSLAMV